MTQPVNTYILISSAFRSFSYSLVVHLSVVLVPSKRHAVGSPATGDSPSGMDISSPPHNSISFFVYAYLRRVNCVENSVFSCFPLSRNVVIDEDFE